MFLAAAFFAARRWRTRSEAALRWAAEKWRFFLSRHRSARFSRGSRDGNRPAIRRARSCVSGRWLRCLMRTSHQDFWAGDQDCCRRSRCCSGTSKEETRFSDEQRQAAAERMRQMWARKKAAAAQPKAAKKRAKKTAKAA